MKVEQLMTKEVYTVYAHDSLREAARIMWDRDCGAVPVITVEGSLTGIITDRDCCMAAYLNDERLSNLRVNNHMSTTVFTVGPQDDVHYAEELMRDRQIRRLPVVDDEGRLRGILSLADIARRAGQPAKKASEKIPPQEVASTLMGISQDRGMTPGSSHA